MAKKSSNRLRTKLKKGDKVIVLSGRHRNQISQIEAILPQTGKAIVADVNIATKHKRPTEIDRTGGIIDKPQPIWLSKLALLDPKTNKPTRIGWRADQDGRKKRFARRSQTPIKD